MMGYKIIIIAVAKFPTPPLKKAQKYGKRLDYSMSETHHKSNQMQACEQGKFLKTEHGHSSFKMLHI